MSKYVCWSDDEIFVVEHNDDIDVVVELVVGVVKMFNWWVVVESIDSNKFNAIDVIEWMKGKCRELLIEEGMTKDYFGKEEYCVDFESCNILSSEFSLFKIKDERFEKEVFVDGCYVYDDSNDEDWEDFGKWLEDVEEVELDEEKVGNVVSLFGDKKNGLLKDYVDNLKK